MSKSKAEFTDFCVVENGFNTCYMDSLFVALFYKPSQIEDMLNNDPKNVATIYLQDLIKSRFVEPLRKHYIIEKDIINEIRNYAHICGWCETEEFIDEQQDISEFYNWLLSEFSAKYIQFEKITMNTDMSNNIVIKEQLPFIPLHPPNNIDIISIRELFINWISDLITPSDNIIKCYKLAYVPNYLTFLINRFTSSGERIYTKIDLMDQIKFFNISDKTQENIRWKISSIICHSGDNPKSGHYFSYVLTDDGRWLLFDDMMIPSFKQIDINNNEIKDKIMLECIFVVYLLKNPLL